MGFLRANDSESGTGRAEEAMAGDVAHLKEEEAWREGLLAPAADVVCET